MRLLVRALLPFVVLGAAIAAQAATVTGTVTSAATNARLSGMVVQAYDASGILRGSASTDATGFYRLDNLPDGSYRLLAFDPAGVYATSFDANAESFETSPLRTLTGTVQMSFALVKGGAIAGKVRDANGTPVEGAVIEAYNLSGTRRGFTSTNAAGDYGLVLPPGEYKLIAYDPAGFYALSFHSAARSFAEATPVRVLESASTGVLFALGVAAHINGTALDSITRAPLPTIEVYAFTPAGALVAVTTSDALGRFRFTLPAGDYRFVAADPLRFWANAYFDGSHSFEGSTVVALGAGEQRNLQIGLTRGLRITGRVSAPNLTIAAYNLDGTFHASTTSDASGDYMLVVAPGEYKIAVSDPAQQYATRFYGGTADFRFAQRLTANFHTSGIDVTVPRGGRVSGMVRDAVTLQALGGITVAAYDASGALVATAVTGADGRYSMVVAPGTYRFLAFDPGLTYATGHAGGAASYETTGPLSVEADAMITVDFTMRRGVRVSGTVTSDHGAPLSGVEVFALDALGNRAAGATANDGTFTIVVPPGTYRFLAVDPFRRFASTDPSGEIAVTAGQTPPPVALTLTTVARRRAVRH